MKRYLAVLICVGFVGQLGCLDTDDKKCGIGELTALENMNTAVKGHYIVECAAGVDAHRAAEFFSQIHSIKIGHVYGAALNGFSFQGSGAAARVLLSHPLVRRVEPDLRLATLDQELPTGVARIGTDLNVMASIDGSPTKIDVDVAVLDTGIELAHEDLNVVRGVDCTISGCPEVDCVNQPCGVDDHGNDIDGHGTHVAGTLAAEDNDVGVVGVAPGARLHAVRVMERAESGHLSDLIAAIDWVTSQADVISVVNISLGTVGCSKTFYEAIKNSVEAGVFYAVAAGNGARDIFGPTGEPNFDHTGTCHSICPDHELDFFDDAIPAAYPHVAAISAMVDTDGLPGGHGPSTAFGLDDSFAYFSNFAEADVNRDFDVAVDSPGAAIDLVLPGVHILSTCLDDDYCTMSGTSMSSPHAAGLAALYLSMRQTRDLNGDGVVDEKDVYLLRQALIDAGAAQRSVDGLAHLDDPDERFEPLGWASSQTEIRWVSPEEGDSLSSLLHSRRVDIVIDVGAFDADPAELIIRWCVDECEILFEPTFDAATRLYKDVWEIGATDGFHTLQAHVEGPEGTTTSVISVSF